MSATSPSSKEKRLARTRRNQRNCRDRKRTRMAELEQQVQELQRYQQDHSLPSTPSNLPTLSSRYDHILQENAALRRLLKAIGIDEQGQSQYLESTMKYDQSRTASSRENLSLISQALLEENGQPKSKGPPTAILQTPVTPLQNKGVLSTWQIQMSDLNFQDPYRDLHARLSPATLSQRATDAAQNFDKWPVGFGTMSPVVPTHSSPEENARSVEPSNFDGDFYKSPFFSESYDSSLRIDEGFSTRDTDWNPMDDTCAGTFSATLCLMDAYVPLSKPETTTLCSEAIPMIFQNNKKHLTLLQLDERLRAGFRQALGPSQGCRIENNVLLSVLAEICT